MKDALIRQLKAEIDHYRKKLEILECLSMGVLYDFINTHQTRNQSGLLWQYLGRVAAFSSQTVRFEIWACSQPMQEMGLSGSSYSHSLRYTDIGSLTVIGLSDLPLYVSWPWKSARFEKVIKNPRKVRLKGVTQ